MKEPLRIKRRSQPPYGGKWILNHPEKGMVGSGYIYDVLRKSVVEYRKANNIPVGLGLDDEIEQALCEDSPEACADASKVAPHRLEFEDVLRGARVMLELVLSGGGLVSQEESERRAAICANCPNNQEFLKPCAGICEKLKQLVKKIIGAAKTNLDDDKKACRICSCFTNAHIWIPLDILDKGITDSMREKFLDAKEKYNCWKIKT